MKKRLGMICIAVLIVILFSICMIWIYRKENASIPTLEEVARMSDEEATDCLAGHIQKELYAAWGNPTMCLSGLPGDWWSLPGDGGEDEKRVTVYYALEYYGEPDGIPVTYVRTPTVQESEDGEAETRAEEESSTGQQGGLRTERDMGVYFMRDGAVQEAPLYASFLDNEVAAVDMKNQEERYWSDYYDKALDSSVRAFHIKVEDMNGDGEKELLLHLRQGDDQGKILVFHDEGGSLVEWESISYGMHSPEINLYNNQIIEVVGHGWSRNFFCYNDKGKLECVFDCYSEENTEENGATYRMYMLQEYEDGVATKKYSMTEFHGANGGNDREVSEEQMGEEEFNRVLDDFLNQLGEGARLNSLFLIGSGEYSDYDYILDGVRDEGIYGYYDINGDGIDELVTRTVGGIKIFQDQDNMIKEICWMSSDCMLLENGTIWCHCSGTAPLDVYKWYCLVEDKYIKVETFSRYDGDLDGCYAGNGEGDVYFYNGREVSKDEWEEWIQPCLNAKEAVLHNEGKIVREKSSGYYYLKGRTAEEFVNFVLGEGAYEQEPYAAYVNPEGELQMVLWSNSDLWCGIRYAVTEEEKKNEKAYGFVINEKENREEIEQWRLEPLEKYTSVDDFTLLHGFLEGMNVQNIQGNCEYDGIGRLLSYEVTGDCTVHDYEANQDVVRESEFFYSIDYIYYDNGMTEKIYSHSSRYFGTSGAFRRTIYDESNREVYLYDSVSGAMPLEEYYLYEDDSAIPFCKVIVDGGSGATGPAQLLFYGTKEKE